MKAKLLHRQRLELLGMLLVLLSAGYQTFLAAPSQTSANDEALLKIRQRVDTIWAYIGRDSEALADSEKIKRAEQESYGDLQQRYFQFDKEDAWENIADRDSKVAGFFFIVGSMCLLLSRYMELKSKSESKENLQPDESTSKTNESS